MVNVSTVVEHVVLPHQADWLRKPELERIWQSSAERSLGGVEDRLSVRPEAWMKLSYSVLPYNHIERSRFDARMRAALKAGKMAVPLWGRGVPLSEDATAGHESVTLVRVSTSFAAGKYVLIQSSEPATFDTFDVALIDAIDRNVLRLSEPLDNGYARGTRVWPLLFGKPITEPFAVMNSARGRYSVTLQFDGRQINATADDDFESYDLGSVVSLDGGEGWAGPWVFGMYAA